MTGQPSPIEQWMINYLATHPDPGLTPGQYAAGAIIMGIIVFVVVSVAGELLMHVSRRAGSGLVVLSLPAGGLFALVAWVIMIT